MVPGGPAPSSRRVNCCDRLFNRSTRCAQARRLAAHILEILPSIADQRGVRNFAVSGHDDLWFGRNQLVEDAKPPAAVDVGVKGRKVREDGEHACLQQVTSEQHAIVDEDGLVAGTMRGTHAAQHGSVSAEVDLRLAVVGEIRSTNFTSSSVGPMSAMSPLNNSI